MGPRDNMRWSLLSSVRIKVALEVLVLISNLECWSFCLRTDTASAEKVSACEVERMVGSSCFAKGVGPCDMYEVPRGLVTIGIGMITAFRAVATGPTGVRPVVANASFGCWALVAACQGKRASVALCRFAHLVIFMCTLGVPMLISASSQNLTSITEACDWALCASCPLRIIGPLDTDVRSTVAYVCPLFLASRWVHLELGAMLGKHTYLGCGPGVCVDLCGTLDVYT